MLCCFPPEPGDVPVPGKFLKAVNGSKIKCYGQKMFEIRIGRKTYGFKAIKADVDAPVLGWDFIKFHKLNFIWNDEGEITLYDKKANITSTLKFKSLPFQKSVGVRSLSLLKEPDPGLSMTQEDIEAQVAAMEALNEDDEEDIETLEESEYKELLKQYPGLLKQTFIRS